MQKVLLRTLCLGALAVALSLSVTTEEAQAGYGHRQYYSTWSYHTGNSYYYTSYYYRPVATVETYHRHYCIHYPSRPRYVYYYNPTSQVYWGRYDLEEQGYSMLKEEDRKGELDAIPESAFPKPDKMPVIPDAGDGERIKPIDKDTLPTVQTPEALPAK